MLDKRYQVFITTSEARCNQADHLAQTLVGMGFFLGIRTTDTTFNGFARRQIDDCDYVILLLGSKIWRTVRNRGGIYAP